MENILTELRIPLLKWRTLTPISSIVCDETGMTMMAVVRNRVGSCCSGCQWCSVGAGILDDSIMGKLCLMSLWVRMK